MSNLMSIHLQHALQKKKKKKNGTKWVPQCKVLAFHFKLFFFLGGDYVNKKSLWEAIWPIC